MMTDPNDKMVDRLLADVADQKAAPDAALMARVMADAARLQHAPQPVPRLGVLAQLRELLGGWPGVGGVALAGVAGLWVGVFPPVGVEDLAAGVINTSAAVDDTAWLFEEGFNDG